LALWPVKSREVTSQDRHRKGRLSVVYTLLFHCSSYV